MSAGGGASVARHVVVNLIRPRVNAALDALGVLEALFLEELHRVQGTDTGLAINVILGIGIQLGEAPGQVAQWDERDAIDMRNFVFKRLADVEELDAKLRVVQRLLCLLHGPERIDPIPSSNSVQQVDRMRIANSIRSSRLEIR